MVYGVFVCAHCSGVHRELNHKVKGLSMCVFNETEIKELKQKILTSNQFRLGGSACCCDELRAIYQEKEEKLMQLSDYWRN